MWSLFLLWTYRRSFFIFHIFNFDILHGFGIFPRHWLIICTFGAFILSRIWPPFWRFLIAIIFDIFSSFKYFWISWIISILCFCLFFYRLFSFFLYLFTWLWIFHISLFLNWSFLLNFNIVINFFANKSW